MKAADLDHALDLHLGRHRRVHPHLARAYAGAWLARMVEGTEVREPARVLAGRLSRRLRWDEADALALVLELAPRFPGAVVDA